MRFTAAAYKGVVPVLLLTVIFQAGAPNSAYAAPPASKDPDAITDITRGKAISKAYGIPSNMLDGLLIFKRPSKVRAILAQTPRHPGDDDVRQILLASCLAAGEKYEEAVSEFAKVKNIDSGSTYCLYLAARTYLEVGNYARSIELANLGLKRGKHSDFFEILAKCYSATKRYDEAARNFEQVAIRDPHRAHDKYVLAANVMLRANKPQQALYYAEKAPLGIPGEADCTTRLTRGLCLEKLNRWADAITELSKAMAVCNESEASDKNVELANLCLCHCLQERIICYEKLGQKANAAADRKAAEKLSRDLESDLIPQGDK
jgi:tetratricopeptide (TPR) repeat protein